MPAILVDTGVSLITTQQDWEGCTATPTAAVDLTSSPGDLKLAAGYNDVAILSPILEFDPWQHWLFLTVSGTRAERTVYLIRWKCATTEEGMAAAEWTPWQDGIRSDGSIGVNLAAWWSNNAAWEAGPFFQWELRVLR